MATLSHQERHRKRNVFLVFFDQKIDKSGNVFVSFLVRFFISIDNYSNHVLYIFLSDSMSNNVTDAL